MRNHLRNAHRLIPNHHGIKQHFCALEPFLSQLRGIAIEYAYLNHLPVGQYAINQLTSLCICHCLRVAFAVILFDFSDNLELARCGEDHSVAPKKLLQIRRDFSSSEVHSLDVGRHRESVIDGEIGGHAFANFNNNTGVLPNAVKTQKGLWGYIQGWRLHLFKEKLGHSLGLLSWTEGRFR